MKKLVLTFSFLLVGVSMILAQEISMKHDEIFEQVSNSGLKFIQNLQDLNPEASNRSLVQQTGDQNLLNVNQTKDSNTSTGNQSCNFQLGNNNQLTLDQTGAGNLLFSVQSGKLTNEIVQNQFGLAGALLEADLNRTATSIYNLPLLGERNRVELSQEGVDNGVVIIQEGIDNSITAGQKGENNHLLAIQKGINNTIEGYRQENSSENLLYDVIIQEGENLSIASEGDTRSIPTENRFYQAGKNLSLVLHSDFINSPGGMEVSQKGEEMKITIDQSYFPQPMK